MYLSAGLKVDDSIYLVECLSRCLISICIPSGESRIEAYLPWEYSEKEIGMLPLNHAVLLYSPGVNHFLIYDCLEHQIRMLELQEMEADEEGYYYSNVLIEQDDIILLPFKGKTIRRYGKNGEVKSKDDKWCLSIDKECDCNKNLFENIRRNSACIAGKRMFFSLVRGKQNYLCRYEWNKKDCLCSIIYRSEDVAIRGVYIYNNSVLFRRIFPHKTEIVLINLDSNEEKIITIDSSTMFGEDVYVDTDQLKGAFKEEIFLILENNLRKCRKIYNFEQQDAYISNGILFDEQKNEILIPNEKCVKKYSIEKIVREIKNNKFYREGYIKLFHNKCVCERPHKLQHLISYLTDFLPITTEKTRDKEHKSVGELIWETIR